MKFIPEGVKFTPLDQLLLQMGLWIISIGKVRNIYGLPGHPHKMLIIATDRASIFDFILGSLVSLKGAVLTAITVMWHQVLLHPRNVANHIVAYGSGIDQYLPEGLRGNVKLQRRAIVVECYEICQ